MREREIFQIKPAKTLKDLYQNLQVTSGLDTINMDYHVPLYAEQIGQIVEKLEFSYSPSDTFFIAGQVGSGKTTLIDYLMYSEKEITNKYEYLYIDYVEEVQLADKNLEIAEIISVLIEKIAKLAHHLGLNIGTYQKRLEEIELQARTQFKDTAQNKWGLADILLEIIANNPLFGLGLKLDTARRTTIREVFKSNLKDFLTLLDDLIYDVNRINPSGKTLLVFMDGLEKIQDDTTINNIFNAESLYTIKNIQCKKMMAIPVHLSSREISDIDLSIGHFIAIQCKIRENPLTTNDPNFTDAQRKDAVKKIAENRKNLHNLIRKRLAPEAQSMLLDETIEHALNYSGGFVVDFCKILTDGIVNASIAKSEVVRLEHVKKASDYLGAIKSQTFTLNTQATNALYHILQTNKKDEKENNQTIIRQLLLKNIIFNLNNTLCYFVHPLIEIPVRIYGKPTQANPES